MNRLNSLACRAVLGFTIACGHSPETKKENSAQKIDGVQTLISEEKFAMQQIRGALKKFLEACEEQGACECDKESCLSEADPASGRPVIFVNSHDKGWDGHPGWRIETGDQESHAAYWTSMNEFRDWCGIQHHEEAGGKFKYIPLAKIRKPACLQLNQEVTNALTAARKRASPSEIILTGPYEKAQDSGTIEFSFHVEKSVEADSQREPETTEKAKLLKRTHDTMKALMDRCFSVVSRGTKTPVKEEVKKRYGMTYDAEIKNPRTPPQHCQYSERDTLQTASYLEQPTQPDIQEPRFIRMAYNGYGGGGGKTVRVRDNEGKIVIDVGDCTIASEASGKDIPLTPEECRDIRIITVATLEDIRALFE